MYIYEYMRVYIGKSIVQSSGRRMPPWAYSLNSMDIDLEMREEPLDLQGYIQYLELLQVSKELKTVLLVSQLVVLNGRLGILAEFATRPNWRDEIKRVTEVVSRAVDCC